MRGLEPKVQRHHPGGRCVLRGQVVGGVPEAVGIALANSVPQAEAPSADTK